MSFLAGRLAATEGSYFLQESKLAAGRLAQQSKNKIAAPQSSPQEIEGAHGPDVLHEILQHSIPFKAVPPPAEPSAPLTGASRWLIPRDPSASSASPDGLNSLRAYVSLPQATFGPKRWQLPEEQPTVSASTANDLRLDIYPQMDAEKLKALAAGYSQIAKGFAVATAIVFGGAAAVFTYTANKLQLESADDFKTKGKDFLQPGADKMREQMVPLRAWAENVARKWHVEGGSEGREKSIVKEISKILGPRTSA